MIEVGVNKSKMFWVAVGSLAFVALGLVLPFVGHDHTMPHLIGMWLLAVVDLAFFGTSFLFALKQLFRNGAALRITEKGIEDHSSMLSPGFVSWDELASWHFVQFGLQEYICFVPKNKFSFLAKQPPLRRFFMRQNLALVNSPFAIAAAGIRISLPEVASALVQHLPTTELGARQSLNF